jgi:hypothetical protein
MYCNIKDGISERCKVSLDVREMSTIFFLYASLDTVLS